MTIISELMGGIIAGSAGILTAVISVHLQNESRRRAEHLLKHKENFTVLKGAISKACLDVYPYIGIGRKEEPFIHADYDVNYKSWEYYSIFGYQEMINKDGEVYVLVRVNKILYSDIENHWPEIYKDLDEWNRNINNMGMRSNEIMKVIFEAIRKHIPETDVIAICARNENLPQLHERCLETCVLATYNFVKDVNPDEWPNLYSIIEQAGIKAHLKKIAEDVKREKNEELKYFDENIAPFLQTARRLIERLDKLIEKGSIPHNCDYIK